MQATPHTSPTSTPAVSPTPTPLALEAQDEVIQGGDSGREAAYPVNLQVVTAAGADPHVWVVQRRRVGASEWRFEPDPNTASFVNGLSVRPLIGIPWSEENAAFFDDMSLGTTFLLTMNTGAVLRFEFDDKRQVAPQRDQYLPAGQSGTRAGVIGETDGDGLPTATRTLVTATYPPEQELSRDGQVLGVNVTVQEGSAGDQLQLDDNAVTLRDARLLTDQPDQPLDTHSISCSISM